ncbi:MAG: hypothetical protein J6S43_00365 [Lentisphaeria bacterium]|nr:hypothetical protein [Lentisphaeria bacterium]
MIEYLNGHRARLRERFIRAGRAGLADYELLELLLFYAIPRRDVKGIAKELLARFGSLAMVLNASPEQLMQTGGIGPGAAVLFQLFKVLEVELSSHSLTGGRLLKDPDVLKHYLLSVFADCREEELKLLLLDKEFRLLDVVTFSGNQRNVAVNRKPLTYRLLACRKLRQVIMCHNHLDQIIPSKADIRNTIIMKDILHGLSVTLLDHIIVCGDQYLSLMKHSGFLTGDTSRQSSSPRH